MLQLCIDNTEIAKIDYNKMGTKIEKDKVIAGVCTGLAEYFNVDVTLVRLLFLLGTFFGFSSAVWIYLAMWIIVPVKPAN